MDPLQQIITFYRENEGLIKFISVLLTVFFLGMTIYSMIVTGWLALRVDRFNDVFLKRNMPKKTSIKAWRKVQKHFFAGDENNLKLAILEADKILDEALKFAGFIGKTLGEKLKQVTPAQIPNINEIWEAHKLRNRIVHETNFSLNRDAAEKALAIYEKTLKDLGILD